MDPNEKLREVCKRVYVQACLLPCSWPDCFARAIAEMRDIIAEPTPSPSAPVTPLDDAGDAIYPCDRCGRRRTKAQGGTTFTMCDTCWDATTPKPDNAGDEVLRRYLAGYDAKDTTYSEWVHTVAELARRSLAGKEKP